MYHLYKEDEERYWMSTLYLDDWCKSLISRGFPRVPGAYKDWNIEYQALLDVQIHSQAELMQRNLAIQALVHEFTAFAARVADIIVREICLPDEAKTVQLWKNAFGIAGGDKYLYGNCFFKFARDKGQKLYGGETFAAKSASNELRAMNAILRCQIDGINLPLAAVIYCRGHCIYASSKLPIDGENTLVCGSCDGGSTIREPSEKVMNLLEIIGIHYNLATHEIADSGIELCTPGDLEVHCSHLDSKLYALDCARLFPPVPCPRGSKSYMHDQFRPEFMEKVSTNEPLCSDAFTRWTPDPNRKHVQNIKEAFSYLQHVLILECAKSLEEGYSREMIVSSHLLCEHVHQKGINIRYIGLIRTQINSDEPKQRILLEMFSRVSKNRLRVCLRNLTCFTESSTAIVVSRFLSDILGNSGYSEKYWNEIVPEHIFLKFKVEVDELELRELKKCILRNENNELLILFEALSLELSNFERSDFLKEFLASDIEYVDRIIPGVKLKLKIKSTRIPLPNNFETTWENLKRLLERKEKILGKEPSKILPTLSYMLSQLKLYGNECCKAGSEIVHRMLLISEHQFAEKSSEQNLLNYISILQSSAQFYMRFGMLENAQALFTKSLKFTDNHDSPEFLERRLKSLRKLVQVKQQQGKYVEVQQYLTLAQDIISEYFQDNHYEIARLSILTGWVLDSLGFIEKALVYFDSAFRTNQQLFKDDIRLANSAAYLAKCLICVLNNTDAYIEHRRDEIDYLFELGNYIVKKLYGSRPMFKAAEFLNSYAGYLAFKYNFEESFQIFELTLSTRKSFHGDIHVNVAWTMNSYARALFSKGMHFSILEDIQAAKKLHLEALDVLEKISSVQKHHIIWTKHCIIKCCLLEWNSTKICDDETSFAPQNCISLLTEIIEYQTQFLPPECPRTAESFKLLAEIHLFLKNTNEARVCLEKAIEIWTKGFGEHCSAIKKCKSLLDFLSHKQF